MFHYNLSHTSLQYSTKMNLPKFTMFIYKLTRLYYNLLQSHYKLIMLHYNLSHLSLEDANSRIANNATQATIAPQQTRAATPTS